MDLGSIVIHKDFPAISALVAYVRAQSGRPVQTAELGAAIGRDKRAVYALVKIARVWLKLTTGEFLPNTRKVGYVVTRNPRAAMFESIKSGNRADGHLGSEVDAFRRIRRDELTDPADVELYVAQQARIRLGEARLALSGDMRPVMERSERNRQLVAVAHHDSLTPWDDLGVVDPTKVQ